MPTFSFSPVKKKEKRKANNNTKQYKIIEKSIVGVIYVTIKGEFDVLYNGVFYKIHPKCFKCKGKAKIYKLGEDKPKRFGFTRVLEDYKEFNSFGWLPFTIGSIVKGNIIVDNRTNHYWFYIKKEWLDYDNELSKKAYNYYKENYEEINKIIKQKFNVI